MSRQQVGTAGLATRDAVRRVLTGLDRSSGGCVLVACSGGPDSLALAAATAFVAPGLGLPAAAAVVDHALQAGSADVTERAARTCREFGLDPVELLRVEVQDPSAEGPEAAARAARYAALEAAAHRMGALAVLLGHTRDDQAESVLLGLLRGSGARSLAGMPAHRGRFLRPFLQLPRATTVAACAELGLDPWADPHNADPAFARARARALLAELEQQLGSGTTAGLARTADLLRADDEALEEWAGREYAAATMATGPSGWSGRSTDDVALDCDRLAALPEAVRTRVLRRAALAAGARSADLGSTHLRALDAVVTDWHGQGLVDLPGPVHAVRECGRLLICRSDDHPT
jgi:tRNA(Ile)-lysidine synthase